MLAKKKSPRSPPSPASLANLRARSATRGTAHAPALGFKIALLLAGRSRGLPAAVIAKRVGGAPNTIRRYLDNFVAKGLVITELVDGILRYGLAPEHRAPPVKGGP